MANTNLPQFGAAGTDNSRDTRSGTEQLTDQQRRQTPTDVAGSQPPAKPASASILSRDATEPRQVPATTPGMDYALAYGGHHNTGYSPSNAT
ncbi:hypothetical protein [Rhodanobacter ginsenosidimutans]|uniref:Catalase n=1 Tax=Rhodanobacter ginsenosidimutans TaxID=490571 RepID=A0ABW0JZ96_9GAMM